MKNIVSLFPDLEELDFELWSPSHNGHVNPGDIKMGLKYVKDWELDHACPKLFSLSFIDGSKVYKGLIKENEWILR